MHLRSTLPALAAATLIVSLAACAPGPSSPGAIHPVNSSELGPDDGFVPVGDTVLITDDVPAVTRLDTRLLDALTAASVEAAERDVVFTLADGWRSERYQQHLFDQAVLSYGSEEEAARWVKRGDESQHVMGLAVDIATADAMDWLSRFGDAYGLCQTYVNESWHFEYVADTSNGCPAQLSDSTGG